MLDSSKTPALEILNAEASAPETLKDNTSPSSSDAPIVVSAVTFSLASI